MERLIWQPKAPGTKRKLTQVFNFLDLWPDARSSIRLNPRRPQLARAAVAIKRRFGAIPLSRRIVLLTITLLVTVYASSALILAHHYGALAAHQAEARAARAQLLAEHAGRAFAAIDLSLEAIAEKLQARLPIDKPTIFTQLLLDKYIKRLPQVRALQVADAGGRVVNNSRSFPPPNLMIADRRYFSEQKKWPGLGLYLDRMETSRVDKQPFFAISRPVLDNNGNFRGVIAAITDLEYFAKTYDREKSEGDEIVLLERDDGIVLAGTGIRPTALHGSGRYQRDGTTDADQSVHQVDGYPAMVAVISAPILVSPQFFSFAGLDLGLVLVMTLMALYLATTASRKATAVEHEAQARQIAEARLLGAIESAPAGFALYDQDDCLVLSNDLYRSLFAPIKELIKPGRSFKELVEAALAERVYADLDAGANREKFLQWRMEQHRSGSGEQILQLRDGRWIISRERRSSGGDTVSFYSDITALKEREQQLQRLNQVQRLFVDAVEHIPSSLMLCDAGDRLVFCNGSTRQYFYKVADRLVPGTRFEDIVRAQVNSGLPEARADTDQWIEERMARHRAGTTNIVREYADGRWAQIVERRTESGCTIGIRTDITEIKRKSEEIEEHSRELQRSNAELEQFAYVASHDLQEPLRMVASYCQLLQRRCKDKLDQDANEFIDFAVEGAKRMQQLVNDLLNYSRVGRKSGGFTAVSVGEAVAFALVNLERAISEAGAKVEVGDLPTVVGDRVLLTQLFQNLVGNAVKFRRDELPLVRIGATRDGSYWHFTVEDNGIGIEREYLERVFLIFQRLHERGKYPGTGIGLAIAKKVVEQHGGRIWIDSVPGQGSRFQFTLPAAIKEQGQNGRDDITSPC
jgi:signal transduction histidine kinase